MGAGRAIATRREREGTRARSPDDEGFVERDGVRIAYEVYGEGASTFLLLPTWNIVHSRHWRLQIPYLARHARVVTFDGRGNGRSDRPVGVEAYLEREHAADALAVLDATGTEHAIVAGVSCGALWGTILAAEHPERVEALVAIGPAVGLVPGLPERQGYAFDEVLETDEGWAKYNSHYWTAHYRPFLEFFFARCFTEPHSTKQIEDCVAWGLETTPEVIADSSRAITLCRVDGFRDTCRLVRCPTLVLHGDGDAIRPHAEGAAYAEVTGGTFVTLEGAGHLPQARDPVRVNLLLRDLLPPSPPRRTWAHAAARRRRALYVCSPIGLGHARRDLAIADELRRLHPDLEIDWLAQHPVTAMLEARGERVHPASAELASESAHWESESEGHDLHCFEAWRRMDDILLANFMVFHDVVRDDPYDLWIGDEAWDVDYYLHENPELKTAAYAWLTDFVGWLPLPGADDRERALTADYNAEMIGQIERFPRVRDRAIFVGDPDDIVPERFGPGLPPIREWTERHYDFCGYVTGFAPPPEAARERLRRELGYGPDERVVVVTVGGSGVGTDLLGRVLEAVPGAREQVPGLRTVVVTGPRIDGASLPPTPGVEVHGFVPDLHRHLAACDLAVVQGGLTTCMELTAAGRPFLAVPLRRHFEQTLHVRHRLERYGAGRYLDLDRDGPAEIAAAIAEEIGREPSYRPVATDGAARAAALIAELL